MLTVNHRLLDFKPWIIEVLASKFDLNIKVFNGDASPCRCSKKLVTASVFTHTDRSANFLAHFDVVWQWRWQQLLTEASPSHKKTRVIKSTSSWVRKVRGVQTTRCSDFVKAAWFSSHILWVLNPSPSGSNLVHSFWLTVREEEHFKMISLSASLVLF